MTASSRGFDEELRARLASLARALRSFKIIKKKLGIPPVTAKQGKIRLNSLENVTKSIQNAAKMPEGNEKEPKGHQQGAQGAKRVPPRCKRDDKWNQRRPNGTQKEPKGYQRATNMLPK